MKLRKLFRQATAALVAAAMALSLSAPALAAMPEPTALVHALGDSLNQPVSAYSLVDYGAESYTINLDEISKQHPNGCTLHVIRNRPYYGVTRYDAYILEDGPLFSAAEISSVTLKGSSASLSNVHLVIEAAETVTQPAQITLENVNIQTDQGNALTANCNLELTLSGTNTLTGHSSGLASLGDLTIKGDGSLNATGTSAGGIYAPGYSVTFEGGAVKTNSIYGKIALSGTAKVYLTNQSYVGNFTTTNLNNDGTGWLAYKGADGKHCVAAPEGYVLPTNFDPDKFSTYQSLVRNTFDIANGDVNVTLTGDNTYTVKRFQQKLYDNVPGPITIQGKGAYIVAVDRQKNASGPAELILDNVNIQTDGDALSAKCDLELTLIGTNTLTGRNRGIVSSLSDYYNLTIKGDGSLIATGESNGIYNEHGNISITGGTVTATSNVDGILSRYGNISITGGTVTATGTKKDGISAYHSSVTIEGGAVKATSISSATLSNTAKVYLTNQTDFNKIDTSGLNNNGTGWLIYKDADGKITSVVPSEGYQLPTESQLNAPSHYAALTKSSYAVTVIGGKVTKVDGADYTAGKKIPYKAEVEITADPAAEGWTFKQWNVLNGKAALADAEKATTTFTMPAGIVKLKADNTNTYPVTVDGGKVTAVNDAPYTEGDEIPYGATVEITADPEEGKTFKQWNVLSGSVTLADAEKATTTFTMPAGAVKLKAEYNTNTYGVTVNGGKVTAVNGAPYTEGDEIPYGAVVEITAAPEEGKTFKQWNVLSGSVTLADAEKATTTFTMPAGTVNLRAEYNTNTYGVTVTGGKVTAVNSQTYTEGDEIPYGATVEITADPEEGKTFKQWNVLSGSITLADAEKATTTFTMPAGAVKLWAEYSTNTYGVTVDGGKVTAVNDAPYTEEDEIPYGATVEISAAPEEGKTFKQWNVTSGSVTLADAEKATTTFTMPAGTVNLRAEYSTNTYGVTVNGGKVTAVNGAPYTEGDEISYGATVEITADPEEGKTFKQWNVTSGSITLADAEKATTTFKMPAGAVNLRAEYSTNTYSVTVTGGKVTAVNDAPYTEGDEIPYGATVEITAAPEEGKTFASWTVLSGSITLADAEKATTTFKMPAGSVNLKAEYDTNTYGVTVTGGKVTAVNDVPYTEGDEIPYGAVVEITAAPEEGKTFKQWNVLSGSVTLADAEKATTTFKMPAGDVSLSIICTVVTPDPPAEEPDKPAEEPADDGPDIAHMAGAVVESAVLGGIVLWGGYEAVTRVVLHQLLPKGAEIPSTQGQLAALLWQAAGSPEPAAAVTEAEKAAQWCIEQGYLEAGFAPDQRVSKFRVIRVWKQAFPKK